MLQAVTTLVVVVVSGVLPIDPSQCEAQPTKRRAPNLVLIMADDLGYGDLSCYGQDKFATPNIDRLASEGIKLTQHYSGSTVCAPTRSSLMTGLHTGHTPIRGNREHQPIGQAPLPGESITIAELLKQAGYATGAFGKWGLGYPGSEGDPLRQGFDEFFGYNCQRNAHTFYPKFLFDGAQKVELDGETYSPPLILDRALQFIRKNQAGPFFCYLPVTTPHAAMQAPPAIHDKFRKQYPQFEDKIGRYSHGTRVQNPVAAFPAMIEVLDDGVGQVLALLANLGIDEQTLVVFTSDNGPHLEGGHDPRFWNSNGPLTGFKRDLTEGGIRVPMLARWPGVIRPGAVSHHISAHWDMLPTLCELAGAAAPETTDGLSFLPTLLDKPDAQKQHAYLYWEFAAHSKRAARMGKWKAIQAELNRPEPGPVRLYNLDEDLAEAHDVADAHPEIVARMKEIFAEAHTPSENFPLGVADKK